MRLGTVQVGSETRAFRQDSEGTAYYEVPNVSALLAMDNWIDLPTTPGAEPKPEDLVNPTPNPRKIICVGLNYHDHAEEVGKETPEYPTLFSKVATSLVGPRDDIILPTVSTQIDWEVELVVVIGKRIRQADMASARDAILGYTMLNDVSVRDWQRRTTEWFQGKNFDAMSPIGPVIVTADELDPRDGLTLETIVNGKIEQSGNTADMIFGVDELVVYVSQFLTLEPGDLIATGTPAGVGFVRTPPIFLKPGDHVVTRIDGIGELINTARSED